MPTGMILLLRFERRIIRPGEVAALVTYLRLQEKWPYALTWRLEEADGKDEDY